MKVIIIGGGIGGLTAAIALAKAGIDAHVYERAAELREVGAGIGLMANALYALDLLGLGDGIRSQALTGVQGGLRNPKGKFLIQIPGDELAQRFGLVAVMHRAELLASLVQRIEPGKLHLDRECTGFAENREGIAARFRNGETAYGDALIGADGLNSVVRAQVAGQQHILYAGYTAWRAVVEYRQAQNLVMGETWGQGCRFGVIPMSAGRVYWFATKNSPQGERDEKGKTRDLLLRLFRGWHEPVEALMTATEEELILRNDIYDMDPLPCWSRGKATLLGDAAHPMTPNLGQGACQGIEDAVVLAACLKKHGNVEPALLEYQQRRIRRTRRVVMRSRRLGTIAQHGSPVLCWIRDSAMRMLPKSLAAQQMKSLVEFEILTSSEKLLFS